MMIGAGAPYSEFIVVRHYLCLLCFSRGASEFLGLGCCGSGWSVMDRVGGGGGILGAGGGNCKRASGGISTWGAGGARLRFWTRVGCVRWIRRGPSVQQWCKLWEADGSWPVRDFRDRSTRFCYVEGGVCGVRGGLMGRGW